MKYRLFTKITLAVALSCVGTAPAFSAEPAVAVPANQPFYLTEKTDIGTLLDTPATKAVLDAHLKDFSSNPQVEMARAMTLKQLQGFVPDTFTDEVLAKIDADLARIAPPK